MKPQTQWISLFYKMSFIFRAFQSIFTIGLLMVSACWGTCMKEIICFLLFLKLSISLRGSFFFSFCLSLSTCCSVRKNVVMLRSVFQTSQRPWSGYRTIHAHRTPNRLFLCKRDLKHLNYQQSQVSQSVSKCDGITWVKVVFMQPKTPTSLPFHIPKC